MNGSDTLHIVLSGGGTGGHLFPGLAVARQLAHRRPGVRITFAGGGKPLEREQVAAAGFDYLAIRCRPRPKRIVDAWGFLADHLAGYRAARRFLSESGADAVIGLGGYASVPMARAAAAEGLPLVLLEQNAVPGRANRWLARRADVVCTAFEPARGFLPRRCRVRLTGNPVRVAAIQSSMGPRPVGSGSMGPRPVESGSMGPRPVKSGNTGRGPMLRARACGEQKLGTAVRPRLLVLGGSGGSRSLNEAVPAALARLGSRLRGWRVLHQAGPGDVEAVRDRYARRGVAAEVVDFICHMPQALADADLAVCRAGGTTLAELAAAGVPAVVVPFSRAADDHQRRNAEVFAAAGACLMVDERCGPAPLGEHVATALAGLIAGPARRAAMSRAIRRLGRPRAAAAVAEIVLGLLEAGRVVAARSVAGPVFAERRATA